MEQLGRQSDQSKSLKRILGAENTLLDLEKREKKKTLTKGLSRILV